MATICVSAFLTQLGKAYGASTLTISLANSGSALTFMPAFIMATQLYNTLTLRKVLLICSIMIVIGAWMRLLSAPLNNMWWLVIGQTVIGISSPFTTGAVSIIANYWFADNERGRATSFMLMSNPLGIFVSFLI
jgi:predicted MFS family arabinose efflux permease